MMAPEHQAELLAMAADDAALGLTAWRAALRRELRALWREQCPAISGADLPAVEAAGMRTVGPRERELLWREQCPAISGADLPAVEAAGMRTVGPREREPAAADGAGHSEDGW